MERYTRREGDRIAVPQERLEARKLTYAFNHLPPEQQEEAVSILKRLFGRTGRELWVEAPFHCDYGFNIEVGEHFYANYNLVILDVCKVTIGEYAMIGPNVAIYTAGHPIHPQARNSGYEFGAPITIGDNCWLAGNVTVCGGVTIGAGCVIGAGSVVTRDIPPHSLAAGNPCRVIRTITEADSTARKSGILREDGQR